MTTYLLLGVNVALDPFRKWVYLIIDSRTVEYILKALTFFFSFTVPCAQQYTNQDVVVFVESVTGDTIFHQSKSGVWEKHRRTHETTVYSEVWARFFLVFKKLGMRR